MSFIEINGVHKRFGDNHVLRGIEARGQGVGGDVEEPRRESPRQRHRAGGVCRQQLQRQQPDHHHAAHRQGAERRQRAAQQRRRAGPRSDQRGKIGRGGRAVGTMAIVTTFSYIIWLDIAVALYVMFFSMKPPRFDALLEAIITTPRGFVFFVIGIAFFDKSLAHAAAMFLEESS